MTKYCTKCGSLLNTQDVFCTKCGNKIEQTNIPSMQYNNPTTDKKLKPWQIALIAGGGIVLAIIIIVIVASSCGSNTKDPLLSTTKTTSTTATTKSSKTETTTAKAETTKAPTTTAPTTSAPTTASVNYSQYAGSYQANTGGVHCPCMDITDSGSYVSIYIYWGAGVDGSTEWQMTAKKDGNKLVYSDCTCTVKKYNWDTEKYTTSTKYTGGSGYFEISGTNLKGSGTADFSGLVFEYLN